MDVPARLTTTLTGRYAIERELGAGGMATVYLARDLRHERNVALKVLHPELSAVLGTERFLHEIKLTANLQHPHILPLFDSGEADGLLFYVMPYVEGESLRARLQREGQLPVTDAVQIATEVAEALEHAHRHGLVHRDVKPENILLQEGRVLLADFGIALAVQSAGAERMTQTGLSLGTPHYMAPEQVMGERTIGGRADVYALGAVTYEMLAGEPPFTGPSTPAVLSRLLTERPRSLRAARPSVPAHVEGAVLHALEKLPADRFGTPAEFADALAGTRPLSPWVDGNAGFDERSTRPGLRSRRARIRATAIPAAAGAGVVLLLAWLAWPRQEPQPVGRFSILLPPGYVVGTGPNLVADVAISADGRRVAYTAFAEAAQRLFTREIGDLESTLLAEVVTPNSPFFSPDGSWIGYFEADEALKRVSFTGGPALTLTRITAAPRGASWGGDDQIVFATNDPETGLLRVPAGGGEVEVLTTPDAEGDHVFPDILPNGRAVLFTVASGAVEDHQVAVLDLRTGEQRILLRGGTQARYTASGHLVYAAAGSLRAVRFDADRLEVEGDPVPVVNGVLTKASGAANFSVARNGSLAYEPGAGASAGRQLVWVDRDGREEPIEAPVRLYTHARISPDGQQLAVEIRDQEQDIWIWNFARRTLSRLTFEPGQDSHMVWSPDGRWIVFGSARDGAPKLYRQSADGTGVVERLTQQGEGQQLAHSVTPDGARLVFRETTADGAGHLYTLPLDPPRQPIPLLESSFDLRNAEIAPDGEWIAYQSTESGRAEVYVRPFPDVQAGQWQISTGGGTRPLWSRDGRELFYFDPGGRVMSAAVELQSQTFAAGVPVQVLDRGYFAGAPGRTYDISPDGRRFLMIRRSIEGTDSVQPQIVLVLNWFDELTRLVP